MNRPSDHAAIPQPVRNRLGSVLIGEEADLSWRILRLLNGYRLLAGLFLLILFASSDSPRFVGGHQPALFLAACAALAAFGAVNWLVVQRRWLSMGVETSVQSLVDISCIVLMTHASGGVESGLANLLLVSVGGLSLVMRRRGAFLLAATAALGVLGQQALAFIQGVATNASFIPAGVLGALLFLVALAANPLARRIRDIEALARQRGVDLANLSQLNEYIIRNLRESIVVVDRDDSIRLINNSAARLLGLPEFRRKPGLAALSPALLELVHTWRENPSGIQSGTRSFVAADNSTLVNAHFAPIGQDSSDALLIFLEDSSLLAERVQQSKLASLGRLSASIAHEIRNPVGAMSHAGQLLAESARLGEEEKQLTRIIHNNANRVSTIIDNILQLSRRDQTRPQRLVLEDWLRSFAENFATTLQLDGDWLRIPPQQTTLEIQMDPSHLDQVMWNLCENALKYGVGENGEVELEIRTGRVPQSGRPFLEVADRGKTIPEPERQQIFEPFFSAGGQGIGLGLFICRELCECNRATLLHLPGDNGGNIFRIIFTDPQRWDSTRRNDTA